MRLNYQNPEHVLLNLWYLFLTLSTYRKFNVGEVLVESPTSAKCQLLGIVVAKAVLYLYS